MSLDILELFFGLLILCSLEHSFRQAAKQKEQNRFELLIDEFGVEDSNASSKPVAVITPFASVSEKVTTMKSGSVKSMRLIDLEEPVATKPRRRARVSSLPIYRSKELDEALQEVRSN